MRSLVVYESMYGATHIVAERIADGLRTAGIEADVVPVAEAQAERVATADLLVVGGPTHMHAMTRPFTRRMARKAAEKEDGHLSLDPAASGPGVREWLAELGHGDGRAAAAFDTRVEGNALLTGRASRGIAGQLDDHGYHAVAAAESFLVDKQGALLASEADRAGRWGAELGAAVAAAPAARRG
jgi:hypothetical protein